MRHIPIMFSTDMVLALLAGRKTMTRRLLYKTRKMKPNKEPILRSLKGYPAPPASLHAYNEYWTLSGWEKVWPGDVLWVKERLKRGPQNEVRYFADDAEHGEVWGWQNQDSIPSIHCPKAISRISIVIEETKIEPIQKISRQDAAAEGVCLHPSDLVTSNPIWFQPHRWPEENFRALWESLHGESSWLSNPEVVAMSGRVVLENISHEQFRIAV